MIGLWSLVGLFTGASPAPAPEPPPPAVSTMPMGGGGSIFDKYNKRHKHLVFEVEDDESAMGLVVAVLGTGLLD